MNKFKILFLLTACSLTMSGCASKDIGLKDNSAIREEGYINLDEITGIGDPYLVTDNGKYYVTATCDGKGYDIYSSEDLSGWTKEGRIFSSSSKEGWVRSSLWQPQIVKGDDGKYYLYYCGNNDKNSLRIGVAVSDSITGPYTDALDHPLLPYGVATIDPFFYTDDDGRMYLYFSRDCSENRVGGFNTSQLYCIEMESYTAIKEGNDPTLIVTPDQDWELHNGSYRWNEGPHILKHDGKYFLFYSGGCYADSSYAIGCATADSPMGPFTKYDNNPIIASTSDVSGPGNNSFFYSLDGRELFNCYHTHTIKSVGGGNRKVTIDRCGFREDGTFYMNGPTTTNQTPVSGHGSLEKLDVAAVTASGTIEGRSEGALIDGETCTSRNQGDYEWRAAGDNVYAEFDLGEECELSAIYIYGSSDKNYGDVTFYVLFDKGSIKDMKVEACNENPAILYFDKVKTSKVRIEVTDMGEAKGIGLSELIFYAD